MAEITGDDKEVLWVIQVRGKHLAKEFFGLLV